jgi:DNA topoisomerase-1
MSLYDFVNMCDSHTAEKINCIMSKNCHWDRVKIVSECPVEDTWDLTIDEQSHYIAEGFIAHNTDSVRVEPDKITSIRSKIESSLGQNYLSGAPRNYSNKDASQDAHEAIRPTFDKPIAPLSSDEKKLLDLVERRFKASQMADATFDQASIKIEVKSAKHVYAFKVSGSILTFDGFLKVYGDNKDDLALPVMQIGDKIVVSDILTTKHFTQAPGRYSDASLIKKLEKEGVGRPSTYASIIETLINRGYAERDKKSIRATELGIMVSDYLSLAFPLIVSPEMTAKMEEDLDRIASGTGNYVEIMKNFYSSLKDSIESAKKVSPADLFKTDRECPECKSFLVKKKSEYGIFLGCSGWPKCGYVLKTDETGKEISETEVTGEPCPSCNSGILSQKKSKFGIFKGCSNYPTCKHTVKIGKDGKDIVKQKVEDSPYSCPKCNVKLLKRESKYGEWHACRNYPKCKYNYSPDKKKGTNKEE